jgi:hypothetical protein
VTKEELAGHLHGREYTNEITKAEEQLAFDSGLLVVFGASDDVCEIRGAIHDETYGPFTVSATGELLNEPEDGDETDILAKFGVLEEVKRRLSLGIRVEPEWCKGPDYSWTYSTNAPCATFEIRDDGELYCLGIVIDLKEAFQRAPAVPKT